MRRSGAEPQGAMVLSASHQVALAFTGMLLAVLVLPRMFGGGTSARDAHHEPRYSRKGPASVRGHAPNMDAQQSPENFQQMKRRVEQELHKPSNSKGYVFTLMPLYAIGVGVFAAYKFLKIKSADDKTQKETIEKGAKKSVEAENQLNELEQRLAQTERMLNSILTQLDPLTHCVKSVAQEQKSQIMSQLQTIRYLMKKRGMDCPPLHGNETNCERNLDELIESLGASDTSGGGDTCGETGGGEDAAARAEEAEPEEEEEPQEEEHEGAEDTSELLPSLEEEEEEHEEGGGGALMEGGGAELPVSGLRRRAAKPCDRPL